MPYKPINLELDRESKALPENLNKSDIDDTVKLKANELALGLRSRLIDLATWKADSSLDVFLY